MVGEGEKGKEKNSGNAKVENENLIPFDLKYPRYSPMAT